jgi:carbonic anhydrase
VPQSWEPFGSARRLGEEGSKPASKRPPARVAKLARRGLKKEPAKRLVVITCMDARIDPLAICGLAVGDANVIRNAGGVVSDDVLRSLRVSHAMLGTRRAMVIGHTDCAAYHSDAAAEAAAHDGVRRIRASAAVPADFRLEALLYDVRTGTLTRLE